jgi:formylglycine-generating enzyme required for sulfatase activity
MHNGQGNGSTETGVYNLNGATSGVFDAEVGATLWIPTMDEWHKAAYYDPNKNAGTGGYWLHANRSNSLTSNTVGMLGAANYYDGDYAVTQSGYSSVQNYLMDVGAYGTTSESHYGTNDQGGSVHEWTDGDDSVYDFSNEVFIEGKIYTGGSWYHSENVLRSNKPWNDSAFTTFESSTVGFRLAAAIPEPTTGLLATLGLFPLLSRRRKA